ncbi:uncharacterized protein LOC144477738 [Augochlora pura]
MYCAPLAKRQSRGPRKMAAPGNGERQKFPCPSCPSVFSHKNNLYYHAKFECGQLPRFSCPYCPHRTRHVSNVRAHVRRRHPGNSVYAIDVMANNRGEDYVLANQDDLPASCLEPSS